ncbi:hypothetical protein H5410_045060 [Solanum commersonii]|uniref:Isopenicillin N synthase-like Fe(2+) 2OG dioxygenase domain-containing protein n=1 Tax=Solanum commersonii TaxID=4109 RepID=A0A9J5X9Y9_SOLCO|nr:hypothetical protein H5410_045060 [Solanum commersonii]
MDVMPHGPYVEELEKLAISLLGCLAKTLKIDREVMLKMYEKGMQSVRMNYYPPYPKPELVTRLGTHSDGSAITIYSSSSCWIASQTGMVFGSQWSSFLMHLL